MMTLACCHRPSADPDLIHRPQVCPGAVLPHARLVGRDGVERSTPDIDSDGGFHLLTGPGGEGWRDVCGAIADRFGLDIAVSLIGPGGDHEDSYQAWRGLRGIGDSGAILVRPDTHVAWMAPAFSAEAGDALERGVGTLLGRSS